MDTTDRRHFPLTLVAVNTIKVVVLAYLFGKSHENLVYDDPYTGHALDVLDRELRTYADDDEYATQGARRYSALLFATSVAPLYWTPEQLGWFQPMR